MFVPYIKYCQLIFNESLEGKVSYNEQMLMLKSSSFCRFPRTMKMRLTKKKQKRNILSVVHIFSENTSLSAAHWVIFLKLHLKIILL